jgi:KamA family protein
MTLAPHSNSSAEDVWYSRPDQVPQIRGLPDDVRFDMQVVSEVLPFRVSGHVVENLIDWDRIPDDPIFRITFPSRDMLDPDSFGLMARALERSAPAQEIRGIAASIRRQLNPHPGDQSWLNNPIGVDGALDGLQHKYSETVLYFPSEGQTCHAFCTFCFRWAQFVHDPELRMAMNGNGRLLDYLRSQPGVTDVLVTGGDPFVIKSRRLRALLEPLLTPEFERVSTIRFGTKALTFRPQRFLTDPDAAELMELLGQIVSSGKHLAIMVHFNHWHEVVEPRAVAAIRALRATGATLRSQSPVLRGVNDDPDVWARMWRAQLRHGIIPYYMFVARDTGAKSCFDLPLIRTWAIYRDAVRQVSGLARTARGPVMSASPGKIEFQGPAEVAGERVFALRFLQARDSSWCNRVFFARADETATWFEDLRPAFGESRFFFEEDFASLLSARRQHLHVQPDASLETRKV